MSSGDHFFLVFLLMITISRVFLINKKMTSPTIKEFHLHHYIYGLVLLAVSLVLKNLTIYAIGWGLFIDEAPLIIFKGPGHREHHWNGNADYYSSFCVAGVLVLMCVFYIFRNHIASFIV